MKVLALISVISACFAVRTLGHNSVVISPKLLSSLNLQQKVQNIVITFDIDGPLKTLENLVFLDGSARVSAVAELLQRTSSLVQKPILALLDAQKSVSPKLSFKSFWASNQITVQNADLSLVNSITSLLNVLGLVADIRQQVYQTLQPIQNATAPVLGPVAAWGVSQIGARTLWSQGIDGTGIVIGSIDSGVRVSHNALKGSYLGGPYAWYDPAKISPLVPTDNLGHGSHTTGIMCGSGESQIGVAKGAKWMACRGCNADLCPTNDLLECGQFMLCPFANGDPSTKDCSKAPKIINNSWGGATPGDTTYLNMIKAWVAAGIIPVFSIGNSGPGCGTAGSPGDDVESMLISVGGTDITKGLGYFSSKGPSVRGAIKPEISAPGDNIYSAWNATDDTYLPLSGTSMAAPHVSGVIALMLQKDPTLDLKAIRDKLFGSASNGNPVSTGLVPCGNTTITSNPNNSFGYGIVDAIGSVN